MLHLRHPVRFVVRLTVGLLVVTVAAMTSSYLLGEWYAFRTEAAQQEDWSAYLENEIRSQSAERGRLPAELTLLIIHERTYQAYRHWLLALVWPGVLLSNHQPISQLPSLQASTYSRFLVSILRSHPVRQLTLSVPYRLVDREAIAAYGSIRWESLFPHSMGFTVLSPVGFNADQTQALLKVDHVCSLCGHGGYVLFKKVNGHWVIEAEGGGWVS